MTPYIVGAVFARGGSKGIPRKNVRLLAGKPLIAHAIDAARASSLLDRVVVSTDDEEIAAAARTAGAEVPFMRPAHLAQDDSPEWHAWRHAVTAMREIDGRQMDVLVSVPTTSPLRAASDIDACLRLLLNSDADIVITVTPTDRNPYFNMVVLDDDRARLVNRPDTPIERRQDAPVVYDMTTVAYAARASFILSAETMFAGVVRAVVVPSERAIDIDSEFSFQIVEALMKAPIAT